ncbi:MAG: hypothetical protein Q9220_002704 [cf. Caloplaca sp. 1 TL-2023]
MSPPFQQHHKSSSHRSHPPSRTSTNDDNTTTSSSSDNDNDDDNGDDNESPLSHLLEDPRFVFSSSSKHPSNSCSPKAKPKNAKQITLLSPDGLYEMHTFTPSHQLPPPFSSKKNPEDIITSALARSALRHVSDGPVGGVWLVEPSSSPSAIEIINALVEGLEAMKDARVEGLERWRERQKNLDHAEEPADPEQPKQPPKHPPTPYIQEDSYPGRWEVLGHGVGGDEGRWFLVHGVGVGPRVVVEEERGGDLWGGGVVPRMVWGGGFGGMGVGGGGRGGGWGGRRGEGVEKVVVGEKGKGRSRGWRELFGGGK